MNTDQGSQFTSSNLIDELNRHGIEKSAWRGVAVGATMFRERLGAWSTRSSTSRPTARPTTVCRPTLDTRREIRTPFISARSQLTHRASAIGCQATARKRLRSEGRRELPCLGSCAMVVQCSPFSCESAIDQRFP